MRAILNKYRRLDVFIVNLLIAEFFLQLVNAAFSMLSNFYLIREGYKDYEVADFTFYRYLAVLIIALPFGLFIKGRKLKPFFFISSIGTPIMALLAIWAIHHHQDALIKLSFSLWSGTYVFLQVAGLPFIILNSRNEDHTRAIALFFMTSNLATFLCGSLSFILNHYYGGIFDVQLLLIVYSLVGLLGMLFIIKINVKEEVAEDQSLLAGLNYTYDWKLLLKAVIPTIIIATGAGLTIQFINLFFLYVHGLEEDIFSLMNAISFLFVALSVFIIPEIKDRWGYNIAITLVQSIAVFFLIIMATTEYYKELWWAPYLAIGAFLLRQPFMNVAGPVTSELTLSYVGKRNRELLSALNSAIWSGCWAISSQIFAVLRGSEIHYSSILFITAGLYTFGIIWYQVLIRDFNRRKQNGLIESE